MDQPIRAVSPSEGPSTCLFLSKEKARELTVGDRVSITVSGEIQGIRKSMQSADIYEVEIKTPSITAISGNQADKALKEMTTKLTAVVSAVKKNEADVAWDKTKG